MIKLRFRDLQERGIVSSWAQLRNLIGKDEVEPWLASRPTAGPPPRGAAKAGRGRPRKAENTPAHART